jgi:putative ABC transport system ATP-binding protein
MQLDAEPVYDGVWLRRDLRRLWLERIGFIFQFHNLLAFPQLHGERCRGDGVRHPGAPCPRTDSRTARLSRCRPPRARDAWAAFRRRGAASAIARALANSPRIILADEPTAALDSQRAAVVMDLLHRVATDHEAAILVVTLDEKIFGHFDRLIRLRDGHVEAEEPMLSAGINQS